MGLLQRLRTAVADTLTPTPVAGAPGGGSARGASPVVPADSPVLQILVRQAELDETRAMQARVRAFSGQGGVMDLVLGQAERDRRRAVADKVRRGQPVTQREVIDATMGLADTLGASGDALRLALAFTPSTPPPAPPLPPAPRALAAPQRSGYDLAAMEAKLSDWLCASPFVLLDELRREPDLPEPGFRTEPWYEVVAICWARIAVAEGGVTRGMLPASVAAWLRADDLARLPASLAPADVRERAWQVDLLTAAAGRATAHASPGGAAEPRGPAP